MRMPSRRRDRKSTRLNSSHQISSYAVFCLQKKKTTSVKTAHTPHAVALSRRLSPLIFFFNDTATTEIYTLSLHDALPISSCCERARMSSPSARASARTFSASALMASASELHVNVSSDADAIKAERSEEHTSELQSPDQLVCRLLLAKKKNNKRENCAHSTRCCALAPLVSADFFF